MRDRTARSAEWQNPGSDMSDYEVGYGKPPKHTRFKPGQSGNPLGRPNGTKSAASRLPEMNEERMKAVVLEEAYRPIGVRDGDRLIQIPVIQAVIRSVALNAAKGHQKSQRMFADLLQWVERENKALHDEWLKTAIEYKTRWERELDHRDQHGITGPEPLPHPNDIVIDMQTGLVEVRGPMTEEQKPMWDQLRQAKLNCDEAIAFFENLAAEDPDNHNIQTEIKRQRQLRSKISKLIPD